MVPPPTLNNQQVSNALTDGQEDDGQYREDPSIYEDPKYNSRAQPRPAPIRQFHQPAQQAQPAPIRQYQQAQPAPLPTAAPAPQYQRQTQFSSAPLYSQQTSLFNQGPQQFPSQNQPQSQVYHQQPQFSYQGYTAQPNYQSQSFQPQYQPQQNYQAQAPAQNQNYNPFFGHPAQNFDPSSGSYSINFTG